jgi:hypothetical protein
LFCCTIEEEQARKRFLATALRAEVLYDFTTTEENSNAIHLIESKMTFYCLIRINSSTFSRTEFESW